MLKRGDQIIYVPRHAKGDTDHPNCERGFVTSVRGDNAFCRYWRKRLPFELRTTANSELTPIFTETLEVAWLEAERRTETLLAALRAVADSNAYGRDVPKHFDDGSDWIISVKAARMVSDALREITGQ